MGVAEEAAAAVVGINAMLAVARLAILVLVLPAALHADDQRWRQ